MNMIILFVCKFKHLYHSRCRWRNVEGQIHAWWNMQLCNRLQVKYGYHYIYFLISIHMFGALIDRQKIIQLKNECSLLNCMTFVFNHLLIFLTHPCCILLMRVLTTFTDWRIMAKHNNLTYMCIIITIYIQNIRQRQVFWNYILKWNTTL